MGGAKEGRKIFRHDSTEMFEAGFFQWRDGGGETVVERWWWWRHRGGEMMVERRWWRDGGEMVIERRWRDGGERWWRDSGGETVAAGAFASVNDSLLEV